MLAYLTHLRLEDKEREARRRVSASLYWSSSGMTQTCLLPLFIPRIRNPLSGSNSHNFWYCVSSSKM